MSIYISILRGINVSGHRTIKMDALKMMYKTLGFDNIHSYVQSGNVIFSSMKKDTKALAKQITEQIEKEFELEVPVIVLTKEQLEKTILENPFANDKTKNENFFHVTFLADEPTKPNLEEISTKLLENEAFHYTYNAIYLYCPNGYGKTKLTNTFLENKLKVLATTRNWKTTNELLKMASK
ncbi:MAG: DUF1697 domain-containing protein [Pseudopedobacter saltans]|uniref:DUF1697 domain-containing protein n=1 Tax=Pseudopedobacter saltans TaxID=151895 RepID=A0A2W5GU19_9SPHI|nr:MAG: DUF1697 domain-containing protein [Pseudopedobacter saltans]